MQNLEEQTAKDAATITTLHAALGQTQQQVKQHRVQIATLQEQKQALADELDELRQAPLQCIADLEKHIAREDQLQKSLELKKQNRIKSEAAIQKSEAERQKIDAERKAKREFVAQEQDAQVAELIRIDPRLLLRALEATEEGTEDLLNLMRRMRIKR